MGLLGELKRRKVTRVAAVYAVTAWVLLQIVDVVTDPLRLPEWFATVVFVLLALGFPIALIMAWAFEMTPEGIQRTSSDDDAGADARVTKPQVAAIVGLVVLASGWMIYALQRDDPRSPAADASTELSSDTEPSSERLHNSLAVLPFENLSPDPDNAYFAAGIHEETLNQLARIKDLSVIARTSVLQYAGAKRPIAEIAAELNVGAILEGSVRYAGDRVRITVQLIDAYKGIHLWSETYDRELIDIFQIETEIAASITKAMRAEFSVEERRRLSKTPTDVFDAYAHYLRAMAHIGRELTFQPVFEELRAAIDLDPNFADALAAMAYFYAASNVALSPDALPTSAEEQFRNTRLAEDYARRALALDSSLGNAYVALSLTSEVKWEWDERRRFSLLAIEAAPNAPYVLFERARVTLADGDIDGASALFARAQALDPRNILIPFFMGGELSNAQQWEAASDWVHRSIALAPEFDLSYLQLAMNFAQSGDPDSSRAAAAEFEERASLDLALDSPTKLDAIKLMSLTNIQRLLGNESDHQRLVKLLDGLAQKIPLSDDLQAHRYLALGEFDRSANYFLRVVKNNYPAAIASVLRFYSDNPVYDEVREQPDFQTALELLHGR